MTSTSFNGYLNYDIKDYSGFRKRLVKLLVLMTRNKMHLYDK